MTRPDLSRLSPEEKDALILALLDRIAALEAQLNQPAKTPDNSSLPPSRGQKANRPPRPKKPRRKRKGPGVTRELAAEPDRVVDCHAQACAHCGTAVMPEDQTVRHAYDHIALPPIRPVVTRVRLFGRRCPSCRRRVRGVPPDTMPPGSPFGPSVLALLAYLHHHHAVSYERLSRLMAELFALRISEGAFANALRRANRRLQRAETAIMERLRRADVIGCDETGARLTTADQGTRMAWEWVLVSDKAVLHRIHPSRGRDVITEVLGEHRPRCWVSDRWGAQQGHAETHQVCLAHVLRDVQYAIDAGEPCFAPALRRLLCWAIAVGRRRPTLKDSTLAQYQAKADRRLDRLLAMPTITEAGAELQRQTKRWRSQFFTFLTDRDVPPTNNASERALRPSVIFRKVTNGFRSIWGADVHAQTRSVIGTGRLNGLSAHQAISRALAGQPIFA
ncbi:IS66 family transposase [Azospirillum soli]|uniref:IS66 family transposase n=1 Tax=Azospirillum soli TaxID=1304799 RepID=UPI001AE43AB9|nr:IS66 family transposase [Azospirillum soli]MBP2316056.1 transposase [Azospirillum soli]